MASSAEELLYSALSFIRGVEKNRAMSALTTDHLVYEQIQIIEGSDPNYVLSLQSQPVRRRTPKLAQLDALKIAVDNLVSAVESAGDDPDKLHKLGLLTKEEREAIENGDQP